MVKAATVLGIMMPRLRRIYFDSNILIGEAWPAASVELMNVCGWAKQLRVRVCIPELVLRELGAFWSREYAKAVDAARKAVRHGRFDGVSFEVTATEPESYNRFGD